MGATRCELSFGRLELAHLIWQVLPPLPKNVGGKEIGLVSPIPLKPGSSLSKFNNLQDKC